VVIDGFTVLLVTATFLLAGVVKGVIGLGLPTVSLALLAVALSLPEAMSLLLVPSFATNLWQASVGGRGRGILRRLWPFLAMATVTVWLGAAALTRIDLSLLSGLLGLLLMVYGAVSLRGYRLAITPRREAWAGPVAGAVNGALTGMTGTFVVPGVMYLQSLGLGRDMLVQAMGMLFLVSTTALAVALQGNNLLTMELGALSAAALLPALVGMFAGQRIRRNLSEQRFRRVFFVSLLMVGGYILASALTGLP
jgi:uncharacterized membrane protein YfcA